MNLKYSVFLGNVGHCFDRYCPAYSSPFSLEELFTRAASIPQLSAVDLVMDWGMMEKREEIKAHLARTGLSVGSLAVDTFANPLYKKGSLSSTNAAVRDRALMDCKAVMDFAAEIGCHIVTLWPGQDGYDYIFAADYIKERQLFADGVAELCRYNPDIVISYHKPTSVNIIPQKNQKSIPIFKKELPAGSSFYLFLISCVNVVKIFWKRFTLNITQKVSCICIF